LKIISKCTLHRQDVETSAQPNGDRNCRS